MSIREIRDRLRKDKGWSLSMATIAARYETGIETDADLLARTQHLPIAGDGITAITQRPDLTLAEAHAIANLSKPGVNHG